MDFTITFTGVPSEFIKEFERASFFSYVLEMFKERKVDLASFQKNTCDLLRETFRADSFCRNLENFACPEVIENVSHVFVKVIKEKGDLVIVFVLKNEDRSLTFEFYVENIAILSKDNGLTISDYIDLLIKNGESFSVLIVDVNDFSKVNGAYGISVGDKILAEIEERLRSISSKCKIFRLIADKFGLVCKGESPGLLAKRVLNVLDRPFFVDGKKIYITVSIGIARYPEDGNNILYKAEIAQREAFKMKLPLVFFSSRLGHEEALRILNIIKDDMRNGNIKVHLQPKVNLSTFKITGAEALMRASVPPSEAIPVIVDYGLIYDVGKIVLKTTLSYLKDLAFKDIDIPLSVNVSFVQLQDRTFKNFLKNMLERYGISPKKLILEITETESSTSDEFVLKTIQDLREMGIGISIDDFGTGYSSLSRLKLLKAVELKVDRVFIKDISVDPEVLNIVKFAIEISKLLSLKSVAEGVEHIEQVSILRRLSCDEGQGFLFSPPVPYEEFVNLASKEFLRPRKH